jgi:ABC-type phosphate transport system substrate-binding protein
MKTRRILLPALGAAAALGVVLAPMGVATAAQPNGNYGFDGNANLVVGGGSTTVYKVVQGLATLYNDTTSCATNNSNYDSASSPQAYPQTGNGAFGQCLPTSQTYNGGSAGGNYDGDNISVAAPVGSSTGIASLNGSHSGAAGTFAYEGTNASIPTTGDANAQNGLSNGYGSVDFAFSSRGPKTSGGNCNTANPTTGAAGDELQCDTFWGIAADGVEVFTWGSTVGGTTDSTNIGNLSSGLTGSDLYNIYTCAYTTWGQLPEYNAAVAAGDSVPPSTAPIVPWSMNSTSGTYADFETFVNSNDNGQPALVPDTDAGYYSGGSGSNPLPSSPTNCVRELSGSNPLPLENDVKPILTDVQQNQGGLSTSATSTNNPANWVWFGSYGLLSAYPYLSSPSLFGNQYQTIAAPLNGTLPNTTDIGNGSYPALRILSLVTKKTDADCGSISNDNGTTDLYVSGGSSGKAGAVREFIRFVCRTKTENTYTPASGGTAFAPVDPYTGVADYNEIGTTITGSGFTLIPQSLRSTGSNCDVLSAG